MPDPPTGTITFLFTDIEGSTNLVRHLGDRYAAVLAAHFEVLRTALVAHGGIEQDTEGDSLFAVFPGAVEAVRAAIDAQRGLNDHQWPEGYPVRVRMGIHSGEATYGPDGYVGLDVHRAARISSSAHGGQIVASASTVALAAAAMSADVVFRDLGPHRLKDLSEAEHLAQVIAPGLATEFAPLRSLEVVPHNLPVQLTSFIGRERELAEIARLLSSDRLVTLTGVGGTGKTRLAIRSAAASVHEYPDGVWVVDLAPVTDGEMVDNALASAMGIHDQPGRSLLDTVTDVLRDKMALIVLDNCEHMLDVAAEVATSILRSCPAVKVLTTSREALGVAGEAAYAVPSLSTPPASTTPIGDLMHYDAVALFADRAALARPGFEISDANAEAITQICRRLDAVPLAIELAAARLRVLSPAEIADRLDDRFRLLTGGDRTAMPRQQTLEATVAWSYDHLSDGEQLLFARLAVCAGSFTLETAEAVAGADGIEEHDVLDLLTGLVEKSMLAADSNDEADTRYRLLETLRQYARRCLIESGTAEEFRHRHARFFADFAEEGDKRLRGPGQRAWFRKLEREHDNLTAALSWALGAGESVLFLRTAGALGYAWAEIGHWEEARRWLLADPVSDASQRADLRARALEAAVAMIVPEDPQRARDMAEQALDLSREAGEDAIAARALHGMGYATIHMFRPEEAVALLEQSLAMCTALDDRWGEGLVLGTLANAFSYLDSDEAAKMSERSQQIFDELGDDLLSAESLRRSAAIANQQDRPRRAIEPINKALDLYRGLGAKAGEGHSLRILGQAHFRLGHWTEAREAFQQGLSLLSEAGDAHCSARTQCDLGLLDINKGDNAPAEERLRDALVVSVRVDDRLNTVRSLEAMGQLAAARGKGERGAVLFGAAERQRNAIEIARAPEEEWRKRGLEDLHKHLDDASFSAAWDRGVAMSQDEAVAYALD